MIVLAAVMYVVVAALCAAALVDGDAFGWWGSTPVVPLGLGVICVVLWPLAFVASGILWIRGR